MSNWMGSDFDAALLDLHLGRLTAGERANLLIRIAADPALAAQNEALASVFAALASAPAPSAAADLNTRICARIESAGVPLRVVQGGSIGSSLGATARILEREQDADGAPRWFIRAGNLRDIIAAAAMIVLVVGLGVPSMLQVRDRNQRIACSANLARLGQGMAAYAGTFNDNLPFAGFGGRASWQPTNDPGAEVLPNRRHVYRLLVGRNAQPEWFVCPSASDVPMPPAQVAKNNDFLDPRNVSYAYQNMAGVRPSLKDNPDLPVLADDNPLFENGRPLFDLSRFGLGNRADTNSRAHGGAGQNILTLSGRVKWVSSPRCGVGDDNIWTLNGVQKYTGREGPQVATDSHLLK